MKKTGWILLAVMYAAIFAYTAHAQQGPGHGPGPIWQDDGKELTPEQFKDMKARVLTMMEARQKRFNEEKACVDAATNADELRKCRPQRPTGQGKGFRGGMQTGEAGSQQPMP